MNSSTASIQIVIAKKNNNTRTRRRSLLISLVDGVGYINFQFFILQRSFDIFLSLFSDVYILSMEVRYYRLRTKIKINEIQKQWSKNDVKSGWLTCLNSRNFFTCSGETKIANTSTTSTGTASKCTINTLFNIIIYLIHLLKSCLRFQLILFFFK